jgi:hypothetical protein
MVPGNLSSLAAPCRSQSHAAAEREVCGVAIRFYTKESYWDLVGNYMQAFFIQDLHKIRDPYKFPDFIRARRDRAGRVFAFQHRPGTTPGRAGRRAKRAYSEITC